MEYKNSFGNNQQLRPLTLLLACFSGSLLEWYDFSVYGFLVPIISPLFFPAANHWVSMIYAYAVFALGYLVRVVGGFVFGRMGDRFGRKSTLVLTVLLMALPTCMMGLLPTYQQIGIWAPLLLVLLRIVQGFAAGGELIGVTTYLYETSPPRHKVSFTSIAFISSGVGILLGSLMVMLSQYFFNHQPLAWRLPFLLAAISAIMGPWLRLRLHESTEFLVAQRKLKSMQVSLNHLWKTYRATAWTVMIYFVPTGVAFYAGFIFMPGMLIKTTPFTKHVILLINSCNTLLLLLVTPLFGLLADRFGARRVLRHGLMWLVVVTLPCFYLLSLHLLLSIMVGQALLAIAIGIVSGPLMAHALSLTKTHCRYTITATSYNLAYSIFGGTIPVLGSLAVHYFHSIMPLGGYIMLLAFVLLMVHWRSDDYKST